MAKKTAQMRVFTFVGDSSLKAFGASESGERGATWQLDIKGVRRGDPPPVAIEAGQVVMRWGETAQRVRLLHPLSFSELPNGEVSRLILNIELGVGEGFTNSPLQWAAIVRKVGQAWQFEHNLRCKRTVSPEREILEAKLLEFVADPTVELGLALQFTPEAREVRLLRVNLEGHLSILSTQVTPVVQTNNFEPVDSSCPTAANIGQKQLRSVSGEKIKLKRFKGKVEEASQSLIKGWIAPADPAVTEKPELCLLLNGINLMQLPTYDRADLKQNGILNGVGFRIENLLAPLEGAQEADLVVKQTGERLCSTFDLFGCEIKPRPLASALLISGMANAAKRGISIIVPIYNAVNSVRACIEAVIKHTDINARLILIDDASPDPSIQEELVKYWRHKNIVIHKNDHNLGFTGTVNVGLSIAGTDDIVLLNSDTRVTPRWVQNLRRAAYSSPNAGSATALSDNAGIFSINIGDLSAASWHDEQIGRLVTQSSQYVLPVSPTAHGFCAYFRGDMLAQIGGFDTQAFPRGYGEENDLSMRANYAGWLNLIDDRTIVFHERSASFGEQKHQLLAEGRAVVDGRYPEYSGRAKSLVSDKLLSLTKFHLQNAIAKAASQTVRPRKRILYVIASKSGGTPQTNQDLMNSISDTVDAFLLHCDTKVLTLSHFIDGNEIVIEDYELEQRIDVKSHRSREYDDIVAIWLDKYSIELMHIRHIAWHSLGLVDAACCLGIPVIFSFHDFYAVCPTVKLLDEKLVYCGGICTSSSGVCQPDLWPKGDVPHLKHKWAYNWRKLLLPMLLKCDAYITTIDSARDVILASYPDLNGKPFEVIPHGRDFTDYISNSHGSSDDDAFRLLIPGNIGPQKGGDIIADVAELCVEHNTEYAERKIEIHVAGRVAGRLKTAPVVFHGQYIREDFLELVSSIDPAVGAVLSIWPETYCHTLTELWAAGIPVIGFDIGAIGERIRETGAGWLIPVGAGEQVFELVKKIASDRADYLEKVAAVQRWQLTTGRHYGTREMGERYLAVYNKVQASRRAFAPH